MQSPEEIIVQENVCRHCGQSFSIHQADDIFFNRISPDYNGNKYPVPYPTLCPPCRLQRRFAHRNQIFVYSRNSSWTKKPIFSMYSDDVPFPVIEKDLWWQDSWNPLQYGRDFDFSRTFFEQFQELENSVPHPSLAVQYDENSEYCNHAGQLKNCYFIFNTNVDEDCMYCETIPDCKFCIDCSRCSHCELCYDCVECLESYQLQGSECCENCSESFYLLNCRSCRNCFGCVNLRRAQYCIFNVQYSKEEYFSFLNSLDLTCHSVRSKLKDQTSEFFREHPRPHIQSTMTEDVNGNYIFHSRHTYDSYSIRGGESLRYCFLIYQGAKHCRDLTMFGTGAELLYDSLVCGVNSYNMMFCHDCWNGCSNLTYCILCCNTCKDLFGCVSMVKKQYCILNKQYSKDEYCKLVPKIIEHMKETGEWGEFFPVELSAVPYNRSMAQRYFPLTEDEAKKMNLRWSTQEIVSNRNAISASDLPDNLPNETTPIIVRSEYSNRPFRITSEELKMYHKLSLPLPRVTYDERMDERQKKLGGINLFERICAKTNAPVLTTIDPVSPWIVWDRAAYEKEFSS